MSNAYFLDSTALIKRYVSEDGTSWIQHLADPQQGNILIISRLSWREIHHTLAYCQQKGVLKSTHANQIIQAFSYHLDTQYLVIEMNQSLFGIQARLSKYPLDVERAIQLASALYIKPYFDKEKAIPLFFISADDTLLDAAKAEGLKTENPNHPSQTES